MNTPIMVTIPELARLLEISNSTAHQWLTEKKLIAWEQQGGLKGPAEQVLGPGVPLPALEEIADAVDTPAELVWDFINNPWPWAGGPLEPPLERLKRGETRSVLDAAPAYMNCMG